METEFFCVISDNLTKILHIAWLNNTMIVTSILAFQGENPIYKSAVTTVVNPKYEGKWWHQSFQWTLLSSIWQLQYLPQVWALRGSCGGIYVISSCCFTIIMYHAATASVFLLTLMIYMHLLYFRCTVYSLCIYFKVAYLQKWWHEGVFSCHRTVMGRRIFLTTQCGHYGYTIYVQ